MAENQLDKAGIVRKPILNFLAFGNAFAIDVSLRPTSNLF